jgi:hypothetical protein
MKRSLTFVFVKIFWFWLLQSDVCGQTVFSRFDMNDVPITIASIGPAAVSADPDATSNSAQALITANCAPTKGLNLVLNNAGGLYDQGSMGMSFRFQRLETFASFFLRGGTEFYIQGGQLRLNYRTYNGSGGFVDNNPSGLGFTVPNDNAFHIYTFEYDQASGIAKVMVDGVVVWSQDGPDNRPLYWVGASAPVVGIIMDGNCTGPGFLDYALFYTPPVPLKVEFVSFDVAPVLGNAELVWQAIRASSVHAFVVERRSETGGFVVVGSVPSSQNPGLSTFRFTDLRPGEGLWFYRVRQIDEEGIETISDVRELLLADDAEFRLYAYPNPAHTHVDVQVGTYLNGGELRLQNLAGITLATFTLENGRVRIPLDTLPRGLYVIQFRFEGQQRTQKLHLW